MRKDKDAIFRMLDLLDRYHGQATGIFTCDEHLAGRSPSQGTELCTVVEAMYSLEVLAAILGDPRLGDRLEKLAFNALPATFKKDMTAHQYDQQCNQVVCSAKGEHVYVNNGPDSNLYGLEPNFGCCTANMHQGWPKFVSHLWMKTRRRRPGRDRLCPVRRRDADSGQAGQGRRRDGLSVSRRDRDHGHRARADDVSAPLAHSRWAEARIKLELSRSASASHGRSEDPKPT